MRVRPALRNAARRESSTEGVAARCGAAKLSIRTMISSRRYFTRASGPRWYVGRGLAAALVAAALSVASLSCAGDASSGERPGGPASSESETRAQIPSSSEPADAVDLAPLFTESLVAQQGTCLPTEREPARSRLVYSLLPAQGSYLRLTVVTSPDGARPVMVDLARGLTGRRILYATLVPSAGLVRLRTFRSASDQHPLVTDVPLANSAAQQLLLLGERALTLPCRGA